MAQTERKEQVTNDLVKGFTHAYESLKKGPSRGTIITLAVIVAAVVLIVVWRYVVVTSTATASKHWVMVDNAFFPGQIAETASEKELEGTNQAMALRFD